MSNTLTRNDLAEAVYQEVGLSRNESADLVEMTIQEICDCLAARENVKISGFASFLVKDKKQRMGRNPKTGQEVPIAPRTVLAFRPSHTLRDLINEGNTKRNT